MGEKIVKEVNNTRYEIENHVNKIEEMESSDPHTIISVVNSLDGEFLYNKVFGNIITLAEILSQWNDPLINLNPHFPWWHQRELQRIHGDPDPDGNCHGIRLSDRAAIGPLQQCQRQSLNGGPCHHGGVEWQQPLQQRQRPLLRIRGFGGYQLVFGPRSDRRPRSVRHAGVPGDHHLGLRKRLPDAESVRFGLDRGVRRDD